MTNIIKFLHKNSQEEFENEVKEQLKTVYINGKPEIGLKIAELNATNILLERVENRLRNIKIEKEYKILELKNSEEYVNKYKTLKQREEMATLETKYLNSAILVGEREKAILKSNKEGLKYELDFLM